MGVALLYNQKGNIPVGSAHSFFIMLRTRRYYAYHHKRCEVKGKTKMGQCVAKLTG